MYQERLSNGVRVLLYPLTEVKSVLVQVFAKGGSLMENPEKNGLAHFMEHMLLQGTPTYKNIQIISRYLETLAGSFNAYTNDRQISFYIKLPYTYTENAVHLAHEIWFDSLFPQEAFVKEQRAVLSEAVQRLDGLGYKLGKYAKEQRYQQTSKLQQFTIGTPDVIEKIELKDVIDYWKTYFATDNTYVLVVGNFDVNNLKKLLHDTFGKQKATKSPTLFEKYSASDFAAKKVAIRTDEKLQTNYLDISFPSLQLESDRKSLITQSIALVLLGKLQTSRLQKTLRWDKGLVYGASADYSVSPGIGDVSFSTEMREQQFDEATVLMTDIVEEFIKKGPTEEEIAHAKQYIKNRTYMLFDEPANICDYLAREFLWKPEVLLPEQTLPILDEVTKEDVIELMLSKWDFSKTQIVQQGPLNDDEKLRGLLERQLNRFLHVR